MPGNDNGPSLTLVSDASKLGPKVPFCQVPVRKSPGTFFVSVIRGFELTGRLFHMKRGFITGGISEVDEEIGGTPGSDLPGPGYIQESKGWICEISAPGVVDRRFR